MITFITIVGISLLIILHELGHYLAARACGMRVLRFSIGFGPALLRRRVGETVWQVAAIPLGGYVQIEGMGPKEEDNAARDSLGDASARGAAGAPAGSASTTSDGRGYADKPRLQRAFVLAAGPVANWLIAVVALTLLAVSVGLHDNTRPSTELSHVEPKMAAAKAGLMPGDRIVSIGGVPAPDWETLVAEIRKYPDRAVSLEFERSGSLQKVEVTPTASATGGYGVLGIQPATPLVRYGFFEGLGAGVVAAAKLTHTQASLLWGVITRQQEGRLSGLPGIVRLLSTQARQGMSRFVETLATLSVVLFILNLTPIPSLDGSRLLFLGIEAVRRKPLNEKIEGWIHAVGLVALLGLILLVSVRDLL